MLNLCYSIVCRTSNTIHHHQHAAAENNLFFFIITSQEIEQIELIIDDDDCGKQRRYMYIYTFIQRRTSKENHIYFCGQDN